MRSSRCARDRSGIREGANVVAGVARSPTAPTSAVREYTAVGLSLLAASLIALPKSVAAQNRMVVCAGFTPNWNVPYDGRFAFVRIRNVAGFGGGGFSGGYGRRGMRMGGWSHDY